MSINITTLESSLQSKFNATTSSTDSKDFLLLAKSLDAINSGAVSEIANTGALPTASANTGRVYFVTADSKLYFSNGSAWVAMSSAADITAAVNALVDSAPGALDTLNELAAALGDDANFSTTVTNSLATKAPVADPTFTGTATAPTINASTALQIGGVAVTATAAELNTVTTKAPLASPTFTGNIGIGTSSPSNFANFTNVTLQGGSSGANLDFKDNGGARTHAIVSSPTEFIVETGNTDPLIFKTNNSEATRIDSSGHLYIGKTSSSSAVVGTFIQSTGGIDATRDGNRVFVANRLSSDGEIINLQKDNSTVGSIASVGGLIQFGQGNANLNFSNASDVITPANGSGSDNDNALDLGSSSARFKDLYLSGGVVDTTTTVSYASSIALSYTNGAIQSVALSGNVTFTDSLADGEAVVLMLDNGASHTVTWTAVTKWVTSSGNAAPTLTANDTLVFWKIGTSVYAAYAGSYT